MDNVIEMGAYPWRRTRRASPSTPPPIGLPKLIGPASSRFFTRSYKPMPVLFDRPPLPTGVSFSALIDKIMDKTHFPLDFRCQHKGVEVVMAHAPVKAVEGIGQG